MLPCKVFCRVLGRPLRRPTKVQQHVGTCKHTTTVAPKKISQSRTRHRVAQGGGRGTNKDTTTNISTPPNILPLQAAAPSKKDPPTAADSRGARVTEKGCMVCPPSRRSCLPLSPIVPFLFPFVGWRVRLPGGLVSPCLQLYPFLFPFVGWCVRLRQGLVCVCVPVLDGVSAFPRSCLPLPPIVSPHACLCWMVCPPFRGLVSPCLPCLPAFLFPFVGCCVRLPEVLSPLSSVVSPHVCLCWMARPSS